MHGRASPVTDSAVVDASTATSATSSPVTGGDRVRPLGEGRVGKAARRRSRASRKAPTTVLNTDTTNFRAMVQQFTGGPSRPFQGAFPIRGDGVGASDPATLSFGLAGDATQFHQQPPVLPLGVQQQQQQQQDHQRYPHFQPHHEMALFMPGGTGRGTGSRGGDVYLPRFGGTDPQRDCTDASDGFQFDRISSSQVMPRPAASTGSSTTDGFLL